MKALTLHRLSAPDIRAHLPRWTVRLRLTLLFGTLFLLSGAGLLGFTYVLVEHATDGPLVSTSQDGSTTIVASQGDIGTGGKSFLNSTSHSPHVSVSGTEITSNSGLTPEQLQLQADQLRTQATNQHAAELHQLLMNSGLALGAMALVSILLGWIVAGRVLDPLRMMTATTQAITASNLIQRLNLQGPDDEIKELGDTIDGLLARLEASFRAQRQFVANASHELRSPLARQRALIQVAVSDPNASVDSLRAAHERVLVAEEQQERILEALFTLTRGQAGPERHESVDLVAVSEAALAALQDDLHQRQLILKTDISPATTLGDPRLIERLTINLIDNAIRYNVDDGRIELRVEEEAGQACVSVLNTGPIVPPAMVERLLQPFQRLGTERTRHGANLGLGLSIVKAIADAHLATLDLLALPDGGLQVTVSFAALAPHVPKSPAA